MGEKGCPKGRKNLPDGQKRCQRGDKKVARWAKLKWSQMVKLSNKAQSDREGDIEIAQPEREGDGATVGEKDSEVEWSQMAKLSNKAQPDREGDMEKAQPEREGDSVKRHQMGKKDVPQWARKCHKGKRKKCHEG